MIIPPADVNNRGGQSKEADAHSVSGIPGLFAAPLRDYLAALDTCLARGRPAYSVIILLFCGISWWMYVPIHELLHASGCAIAGGRVSRLEIADIYGASLLNHVFPFVTGGSGYAGRLASFDTGGSDFIYFVTDFFPYLLTIFLGVPLLKSAGHVRPSKCGAARLGLALPVAYAPFISLFGDFYEMGSIFVSKAASHFFAAAPERWRSDDLVRLARELFFSAVPPKLPDAVVVAASLTLGIAMIFATYWLGTVWTVWTTVLRKKVPVSRRFQ
jgi:hypothetical protein